MRLSALKDDPGYEHLCLLRSFFRLLGPRVYCDCVLINEVITVDEEQGFVVFNQGRSYKGHWDRRVADLRKNEILTSTRFGKIEIVFDGASDQ